MGNDDIQNVHGKITKSKSVRKKNIRLVRKYFACRVCYTGDGYNTYLYWI